MTKPKICREQSCNEKVRKNHYLFREHWEKSQEGAIDECPETECDVYKGSNYTLCVECNKKKKDEPERKKKPGPRVEKKTPRRYDPVRADTFESGLLYWKMTQKRKTSACCSTSSKPSVFTAVTCTRTTNSKSSI